MGSEGFLLILLLLSVYKKSEKEKEQKRGQRGRIYNVKIAIVYISSVTINIFDDKFFQMQLQAAYKQPGGIARRHGQIMKWPWFIYCSGDHRFDLDESEKCFIVWLTSLLHTCVLAIIEGARFFI